MRAFVTTALAAVLAAGTAPAQQTIAITNARIHTVSGPVIERGTLVIRGNRIEAVGADVSVPAGARVIDATGKVVTPGLLDSSTQLGLVEIGAVSGTDDATTRDDKITAAFDVAYGINPLSSVIPITRVEGITRAVVAPQGGISIISGQGSLIDLGGDRLDDILNRRRVAMFAVLDENAAEKAGGSRGTAMLRLREALEDARDFSANRRAWETASRREYALSRLDLDALAPVARGEMTVAIHADRAADIVQALHLARDFGLRMVLLGAGDGWMVADEIARSGVPVVLNPMQNIPEFDNLGATLENAARLHAAGVTIAFASFDTHNVRNLKQGAGNAVAAGLPHEVALQAVTLTPARLWGIADRYGSLEVGKDADVVVWSGDPFEPLTMAEHVFIEGQEVPKTTRQWLLFQRYRRLGEPLPPAYQATDVVPPNMR